MQNDANANSKLSAGILSNSPGDKNAHSINQGSLLMQQQDDVMNDFMKNLKNAQNDEPPEPNADSAFLKHLQSSHLMQSKIDKKEESRPSELGNFAQLSVMVSQTPQKMDASLLKHLQSYYSKNKSEFAPDHSRSPVTSLPTTHKAMDFGDDLSFKKELIDSFKQQETPQLRGESPDSIAADVHF